MKKALHFILFFFVLLLAMPELEAQYRYGANGRRRSVVPQTQTEPQKKADPLTAEEMVANEMPKITEAIGLNDFEQAVVSSILTKYVQQRIELQILDLGPEKTREAYENMRIKQEEELKAGLPEEKFNALLDYQENGFKKVKKKKKRKKKDKS